MTDQAIAVPRSARAGRVGVRAALGLALRDFYANSWRLAVVNAALGALLVGVAVLGLVVHGAFALLVLAGPLAAALAHCAVTLVRTGNVVLRDAVDGLRLHWRRGLVLGAAGGAVLGLAALAVRVYGQHGLWPLAFATVYVVSALGLFGLIVLILAVAEPQLPLRVAGRRAGLLVAGRPGATLGLGLALLVVNGVGVAAAVMPFLTLTIAFSFVAAAHFALPDPTPEELR